MILIFGRKWIQKMGGDRAKVSKKTAERLRSFSF
jgi:hypothetical protein